MIRRLVCAAALVGVAGVLAVWLVANGKLTGPVLAQEKSAPADGKLDRTVLPIPEPNYPHCDVLDARDAKAPPRFQVEAPKGAPNVLIVLIDDIGFGMSEGFGRPIHMPTGTRLGPHGRRYNRFRTRCARSPTRAASPRGRN